MEKQVVERVHELLNTSSWQAEYCHPDKWKDKDMDKCIDILEKTIFSLPLVKGFLKDWEPEILQMMNDYEDASLVSASLHFCADTLAWQVLHNDEEHYKPDSATFKITNQNKHK